MAKKESRVVEEDNLELIPKRVEISIPNGLLKKVNSETIAEFDIPEEVLDLGDGAEPILREGKTIALVKETYEFVIPTTNNLLPEKTQDKKRKKSRK